MALKTSSCKAKGRRFQQFVRDALRKIGEQHGLVADDYTSTGMGQSGVDVILSPAAKKLFPCYIECKNVEKLNVITTFVNHFQKYKDSQGLKVLFHTKNHGTPLATVRLEDLLKLIEENLDLKRINGDNQERKRKIPSSI
jgi:hypothetical protein